MSEKKRKTITHQFLQVVKISEQNRLDRFLVPVLLAIGVLYCGIQALLGNWLEVIFSGVSVALLVVLAAIQPVQRRVLGQAFTRVHALYVVFFWVYSLIWLWLFRMLLATPSAGKESRFFYVLLFICFALTFRMLLTLFALTPPGYRILITRLPIWEQILVAVNEAIAAGLLAYVGGGLLAQILQPQVFTTRFDAAYNAGLLAVVGIYYLGMQMMWVYRWNNWLSRSDIWVRLARVFGPLALIMVSLVIYKRFIRLGDPRTSNLLGTRDFDLAVLALSPVIWLMLLVLVFLVYTGRRGLRQRFLPNELLEELPPGFRRWLSSISDMDMLLIIGLLSTSIPAHLLLLDDSRVGLIDTLRQQILQRGSALIETSEQALALLFTIPFYVLIVALLGLYAFAISRVTLSAERRNELVEKLPNGFLIILIITLYLCAIPFTQALTEGRLPQLTRELGRILAFYVLIPLVLLYVHYFLLVRLPYGRGQRRWREMVNASLKSQLVTTENSIAYLSERIRQLERDWRDSRATESEASTLKRLDILYHYVEINSERDTLNMNRLKLMSDLQQLSENELEIPLAIARLPTRVVRYGIPLLLAINIYQWAILNDGLRQIADNPNITIVEFFRIILQQTQF